MLSILSGHRSFDFVDHIFNVLCFNDKNNSVIPIRHSGLIKDNLPIPLSLLHAIILLNKCNNKVFDMISKELLSYELLIYIINNQMIICIILIL
ncbi:unnamed protein product [Commensalibacter papalotli (ex Botero et al. 2024)]|uniref:Uncharacterized protein n=1 Tax=Commensalibacter papalotli (ex Botero et al. 2024) TaxID=2972766 RepID=A0ABM9HM32_9PROT|nr:unnamed protein product [Commensalibacter papalotli (ex Botero et al. 2024)]CAI3952068.1 unnamed protein product [Commensalibacter papalotli (ex Botero et al. 2024)]